jgi:23S rRNA (guanosine2251-2'-O)-methyltransferase
VKTVPRLPLTIVLNNLRSAYNVGSILRSADVVWVERVITCGVTPRADHPKVKKTALGSEMIVRTTHHTTLPACVRALQANGVRVCAMEPAPRAISLWDVPAAQLAAPLALVFGSEVEGVPLAELTALGVELWALPQFGVKSSLNVAVAASVAMYHIRHTVTLARLLPG